jgi:CubicO group peptidase (beta-lactamase class C family)
MKTPGRRGPILLLFILLSTSAFSEANGKPAAADGIWLGKLEAGGLSLRIQLNVKSDSAGLESCTLDSLDQDSMGIPCANTNFAPPEFAFDVPAVHGHWQGKLSEDGLTLTGTWNQGSPMQLNFARQTSALKATGVEPPAFMASMPPVKAADIEQVLKKDLAEALATGSLASANGEGLAIAVSKDGERHVFGVGAAKPDSLFEIGSITKTFTGLILAQMVEQKRVKLDDPVRELLPPGTVAKPEGAEIRLLDLATQHSGLPRMPTNFHPKYPENPYVDYAATDLYAFVAKQGVAKSADPVFLYSNLGFGLLGNALAAKAGISYEALLKEEVTGPLALQDTAIKLSDAQQARFLPGHNAQHRPAHAWDLDALAGAGAIRSTAGDMLRYMEANLHPEALAAGTGFAGTLPAAVKMQHELRADSLPGMKIGLAWLWNTDEQVFWHNGGTGGYGSYAFFGAKCDCAVVVLSNEAPGAQGSLADRVGQHLFQRLQGLPAIELK